MISYVQFEKTEGFSFGTGISEGGWKTVVLNKSLENKTTNKLRQ